MSIPINAFHRKGIPFKNRDDVSCPHAVTHIISGPAKSQSQAVCFMTCTLPQTVLPLTTDPF